MILNYFFIFYFCIFKFFFLFIFFRFLPHFLLFFLLWFLLSGFTLGHKGLSRTTLGFPKCPFFFSPFFFIRFLLAAATGSAGVHCTPATRGASRLVERKHLDTWSTLAGWEKLAGRRLLMEGAETIRQTW